MKRLANRVFNALCIVFAAVVLGGIGMGIYKNLTEPIDPDVMSYEDVFGTHRR
ncbi:MAG TPA: hypothetical protein VGN57_18890 [Pirellulaceae bacterium]|jgi:hypothetical protein|nr:hypothetical protein [Pirellulaceae bacterium]